MSIPTNNPGTGSTWTPAVSEHLKFQSDFHEYCTFHIDQSQFSFRVPFCQRDNQDMKRVVALFEAWRLQFKTPEIKP